MCISTPKIKPPEPPNLQQAERNASEAQSSLLRAGAVRTILSDRTGDANRPSLLRQVLGGA